MAHIYIAGPLFNSHERAYLEQIASALEQAGHTTFLPHRDAGLLTEITPENRQRIFRADLDALDACDLCVALLTGPDHDSGTCAELGYMYAQDKLCFGITDDIRWLNNLIWGLCGEGERLVKTIPELVAKIGDSALR